MLLDFEVRDQVFLKVSQPRVLRGSVWQVNLAQGILGRTLSHNGLEKWATG